MNHLEHENHKLREEVTTLRPENEILRNLVSLMTVAQSQQISLPIVSTQAQTVASTVTPRIPNNVNHTCKSEYYNVYGMLHFVKYLK